MENSPMEEMLNPQTTLMLEHISARLPSEEAEKGIISGSGRLNKEGRALADDVYSEFLKRANGNYREVLNICKEAESLLHADDTDSRDMEMLKVLRSVRGKVVYHAHKTWAEKEMLLDKFGDESASNVMSYAKTLKKDKNIDIYEEATRIEREKQSLDEKLKAENERLEQQNLELLEQDIETVSQGIPPSERKSILEGLKGKLKAFSEKVMEPSTRRKIIAGAISAVAVTSIVLGYISHLNEGGKINTHTVAMAENQPKATLVAESAIQQPEVVLAELPAVGASRAYELYEESYFTQQDEVPAVNNSTENLMVSYRPANSVETVKTNITSPKVELAQIEEQRPSLLLVNEWSPEESFLELSNGSGEFIASLFLEKNTDFNYWKGKAPDGRSALIWNATEAAIRFGEVTMKPGDSMSFTQRIGFGDIISGEELKSGVVNHGDGYIVNGEGACFAATVFGEGLGLFVVDDSGNEIPLFKTDVGAVQSHGKDKYGYYNYLYHGPGVAINSSEQGQLFFSLNPDLPEGVTVTIKMGVMDTDPENSESGIFSPTVTITMDGLPEDWNTLKSLRLTGNRPEVLEAISGRGW